LLSEAAVLERGRFWAVWRVTFGVWP